MDDRLDRHSARLGAGMRALRLRRGLTLVALAELSGLSHPFLSQVERAKARPSIVSLEKIARALGTSQLELLAAGAELEAPAGHSAPVFVASGEGERGAYGSGEARLLVRGDRRFHPMEFVGTNSAGGEYHVHQEDEFIYCLEGHATIDLAEGGLWNLSRGDSLYFVGGTPHRWFTRTKREYRLILVKQHLSLNDASVVWDPNLLPSKASV
ncbi:MAG: helix-turn-helix domain-containing protein [Burkholderiaceae bacterium]|nr:helix-turn-helix domain-containing protein [Microbacteriaceae bacterium]